MNLHYAFRDRKLFLNKKVSTQGEVLKFYSKYQIMGLVSFQLESQCGKKWNLCFCRMLSFFVFFFLNAEDLFSDFDQKLS